MSDSFSIDKNEIHRLRREFLKNMSPAAHFISLNLQSDVLQMGDYSADGLATFRVRTKDMVDTAVSNLTQRALKEIFGEENVKVFAEPEGASKQNIAFVLTGSADQLVSNAQNSQLRALSQPGF